MYPFSCCGMDPSIFLTSYKKSKFLIGTAWFHPRSRSSVGSSIALIHAGCMQMSKRKARVVGSIPTVSTCLIDLPNKHVPFRPMRI
jgi:hypothetical protein